MSTLTHRPDRDDWYRDEDGIFSVRQDVDETRKRTFDYVDKLGALTISSSAWESSGGITRSSPAATTTTTTITIAGTDGELINTLTLSDNQVWVFRYRFVAKPRGRRSDYGS